MRKFLQDNFLALAILNSSNFFSYLFQLIIARALSASDYGSFNALASLSSMILAPLGILPMVIARFTVRVNTQQQLGQVKTLVFVILKGLFFISLLLLLVGALSLDSLKIYLHIDSYLPVILMLLTAAVGLFHPILVSVLQGLQRIIAFSLCNTTTAVAKVGGVILFVVWLGGEVNGALLAGLFAILMTTSVGSLFLKDVFQQTSQPLPTGIFKDMRHYAVPVGIFALLMAVLGNVDLVLVRHYLPDDSGLYATATILGKIAFFAPSELVTVLFPEAAKNQETGQENTKILWITLALVALIGGSISLVCNIFPEWVITILFGDKYIEAAPLLRVTSLAMALFAITNILFNYNLAHFRFGFLWIMAVCTGLLYVLISFFHETPLTIAYILLSCIGLMLITSMLHYLFTSHRTA